MHTCGSLIHAESVYAYYTAAEERVTVVADVFLNPFLAEAYLCPNPIALRGAREFLVESVPRFLPGLHPMIEVKQRISYSFAVDEAPKSVVVYSMGVDEPARQEVPVCSTPPPVLVPTTKPATPPEQPTSTAPATLPFDVVGFSASFSFDEAIQDALKQALAKLPSPPRNPDVSVGIVVKTITANTAGNRRPGLFITATAQ